MTPTPYSPAVEQGATAIPPVAAVVTHHELSCAVLVGDVPWDQHASVCTCRYAAVNVVAHVWTDEEGSSGADTRYCSRCLQFEDDNPPPACPGRRP